MTIVRFEAGVLGDAIKKAARIAPSRGGMEMDKAAGIILDIDPSGDVKCVIRATDTHTFYLEALNVLEATGDKIRWRLQSSVISGLVSSLAARGGSAITIESDPSQMRVLVKHGRLKSHLNLILNESYPTWGPSDASNFTSVTNIGEAITRVEWCAAKDGVAPYNGVLLDGSYAVATDRYRMARTPLKLELDGDVLFPAFSLGAIVSNLGSAKVGSDKALFVVQPDAFTQFKTVMLAERYPGNVHRRFDAEYAANAAFDRRDLIERIQQATSFAGSDRDPVVDLFFGAEQIAVVYENAEVGKFGDVIDIPGFAKHDRVAIRFAPKYLLDCLSHSPTNEMFISYDPATPKQPVVIASDSGYEAILAPRAEMKTQP